MVVVGSALLILRMSSIEGWCCELESVDLVWVGEREEVIFDGVGLGGWWRWSDWLAKDSQYCSLMSMISESKNMIGCFIYVMEYLWVYFILFEVVPEKPDVFHREGCTPERSGRAKGCTSGNSCRVQWEQTEVKK